MLGVSSLASSATGGKTGGLCMTSTRVLSGDKLSDGWLTRLTIDAMGSDGTAYPPAPPPKVADLTAAED